MSGKRAKARRRASGVIRDGGGVRQHRRAQPPWRWIGGMAAGAASGLLSVAAAWALPEGGVVASGSAMIGQPTPSSMVVQQGSPQLILNWQGFSIGQGQTVRFAQPSSSAVALNRVVGQDPSQILGSLLANGRIFLTNPNGVLFGPSASVDVGSLLATTLQITDQDFLMGKYHFTQSEIHPLASVVNQGEIVAAPGGFVSFVAPEIMNRGTITARLGTIALGAAEGATLDLRGDGLINLILTEPVRAGLLGGVTNAGKLQADGGYITLSAKVAGDVLHSVVNNEGVIEAGSLVNHGGVVTLLAADPVENTGQLGWENNLGKVQNASGIVTNYGTIDVSAKDAGAAQGQVTLAGERVGHAGAIRALGADNAQGGRVLLASTDKTVVTSTGTIDTSGIGNSSAGNVVVWSDKDTIMRGTILARGGAQGGDGGSVTVQADQGAIEVQGTIDITGTESSGGNIQIAALSDITLDSDSRLLAGGRSGGEVRIESREGTLLASGLIDGQGSDGNGGRVLLLAPRVGLINETVVNVSGQTGGGTVLVGGNFHGAGPEQNASATYVAPGASIIADATESGDGGNIAIWSEDVTRVYGSVSARGGAGGGNGGFVETSSHNQLDVTGMRLDLSAPRGQGGNWLIDPYDVTITAGATSGETVTGGNAFAPNAAGANIAAADINTQLNNGTSVTITTAAAGAGTDPGNITQSTAISKTAGGDATLTMTAAGTITTSAAISSSTGMLNVVLRANDNTGGALGQNDQNIASGDVLLGGAVTTNGGTFQSSGINFDNTGGAITTGGGSVTLAHTGNVAIAGAVTTNGGTFQSSGINFDNTGGAVTTNNGNLTLTHTGDVTLGAAITVGSGNATIIGNSIDNPTVGAAIVIADTLNLAATTTIGATHPIDTTVNTLNAVAGGNINILEADAVTLGTVTSGGSINIANNTGNIMLGTGAGGIVTAANTVSISAAAGNIVDGTGGLFTNISVGAGHAVTLSAAALTGITVATDTPGTYSPATGVTEGSDATVGNVTSAGGVLRIYSPGDLTMTGTISAGGAAQLNAVGNVAVNGVVTTNGNFDSSGVDFSNSAAISTNGGAVTLSTGDSVALSAPINTGSGSITINFGQATGGTFTAASTITTSSSVDINGGVNADTFDFSGAPAVTATLAGGGGSDTLKQASKTWTLNDATQNSGTSGGLTWSAIGNLTDTGAGIFNMGTAGSVSGNITAVNGTLNYSTYATDVTFDLAAGTGTTTGIGGTWSGVSAVDANPANSNTVIGSGATYTLTDGVPDAGSNGPVAWTAFQNLADATGTVDFQASGSVTGNVTAQTLNYSTYATDVTFDLAAGTGTTTGIGGTWSGVSAVDANPANSNTVIGSGATYTLTDGVPDAGSNGPVAWTAFQNLADATGTVDFQASGSVTGNVTAQTLNYSTYATDVTFDLAAGTGTTTGIGGTWSGVSAVDANPANSNTVIGSGATYTLTDGVPDAGSNGPVAWTAFQNLADATGTVDFQASGSVTGNVTAQTLNYSTYATDVTFDLAAGTGTTTGIGGTWSGVSAVDANPANSNTVIGSGATYTLTDGVPDAGSNGPVAWTAFQNLADATGTVDFQASGSVTGNVTAQTLNYSTYATDVTFDLAAGTGTTTGIGGTWSGVSAVDANPANSNTVIGSGATYTLTDGVPDAGSNGPVAWTAFQNLADATGTVDFQASGSVTGNVTAQTLNYSTYATDVTFDLAAGTGTTTGIGGTWSGVSAVDANPANSNTVIGSGATYTLTDGVPDAGSNGPVAWTAFQNLADATGTVDFQASGSVTGNVTAQTLNYSTYATDVTFDLAAGTGTTTGIGGTWSGVSAVDANPANSNTVIGSGATYTLTDGVPDAGSNGPVAWTAFQNLADATGTVDFQASGSVTGNVTAQTLNYSTYATDVTFDLAAGTGTTTGIGGTWSGVSAVDANPANSNTVIGSGATYTLTDGVPDAGSNGPVAWTAFQNLADATGTVDFQASGSVTGNVTAQTLNYSTYATDVTFDLAAGTGTTTGIGGTWSGVSAVDANPANSNTVIGSGATYTLTDGVPDAGSNGPVAWTAFQNLADATGTVDFQASGSVTGNVTAQTLNYSTYATDVTFDLAAGTGTTTGIGGTWSGVSAVDANPANSNTVIGSGATYTLTDGVPDAGSNGPVAWTAFQNLADATGTVDFQASGSVTGNVTAQTLNYSTYATDVTFDLAAGTGTTTGIGGTWSGVSAVDANPANSNTVIGSGATYTLTDGVPDAGSNGPVAWTAFQNLADATGTVDFQASGSVTGNVTAQTLNYSTYATDVTFDLAAGTGTTTGIGGTWSGVSAVDANPANSNTVIGSGATYTLTDGVPDAGSNGPVAWTAFQNLADATGTVDFQASGSVTGNVTAQTLNYSTYATDVTFDLAAGTGTTTGIGGTWSGVSAVDANPANSNTVIGSGATYTLTDGVPDAGSNGPVAWTAFQNLADATGTVDFQASGSVTGNVTAQTLNYSTYATDVTFDLAAGTGTTTGIGGTWSGVSAVDANPANSNTVIGSGATYTLTDGVPDAGSNGPVAWTAFQNLADATGTVDFQASGSVTGNVTAQTLNYSTYATDVTFDLAAGTGTTTGIGGTWSGVSAVDANPANSNTVIGSGATYTLTDGVPDAGSNGPVAWTAFQNLADATGTVDFQASGSVTGNVTAQTLNYSTYATDVTFDLAAGTGTTTGIGGTWSGVSAVDANPANSNTVIGSGATYTLTDGVPDAGSNGPVAWTAFQNLADATGTVDFQASGSVTGNVTAQTLNYSTYATDVTFDLAAGTGTTTGIGGTWSGVSAVDANPANSNTVIGSGATYTLTDGVPDAGSNGPVAWTAFQNLADATGTVDFQASGSVTGNVTAQTLNYSTYATDVTFDLAAGTGTTTGIGGTWSGVSAVDANPANSNTVIGSGATYTLTGSNAGNDGTYFWTAMENLTDTAAGTFKFAAGGSVSGNVTATGGTLDYSAGIVGPVTVDLTAKTGTGIGGTWNGITTVTGSAAADTIGGTGQTYTLTGANAGNNGTVAWTSMENVQDTGTGTIATTGGQTFYLTGANQGTVGLLSGSFSGIANLQDTGAATFNMHSGADGSVSGNITAVNGTLDYTGYTTGVTLNLAGTGTTGIGGTWSGITAVTGPAAQANTLTGLNQTYTLDNVTPDKGNNGTVVWTAFKNLTDTGTGVFNMGTGGSVTGNLNGGTGGTLNYGSYSGAVTLNLAGTGTTGVGGTVTGIRNVTGSSNSDTVTGSGKTYNLTGANAGNDGTYFWTSFEKLTDTGAGTASFAGSVGSSITGALVHTAGATDLSGAITAGAVSLAAVRLTADTIVDTSSANGNITATTVDATTIGTETLGLKAGSGDITFSGAVGGGTRLGTVTTNSARNFTESAGLTAVSLTQSAGTGTTTLDGAVNTNGVGGVVLTTNAVTLNNTLATTGGGPVTFTNAGLLTLNGNITADGAVTQNGAGLVLIDTDRSITTTGDAVSFASDVRLNRTGGTGTLSIDTTTAGNVAGAGISFDGELTGTTAGAEPLTLTAGTGGSVRFEDVVGGTRLGAVTINSARNVTEAAGLTAASLTQVAGTGTTLLSGAVNTNTGTGVSLTTAGAITVDNTLTTTGGGTVTLANGGLLTLNGDIAADGAVAQTGAGLVTIDTDRSIITTGDAVGFATGVTLVNTSGTGTLSIDTTTGGNATGNSITFSGTLDGTTAGAEPVTLTAGTNGNLLFTGAVGTTGAASRLGAVTITNAKNVTESAGLTAASLTQLAGTGTTTLEGAVNTNTATGVHLTGTTQTVNAGITTTGNGPVTFTNAGLLTLNGDIAADGGVIQNGAGTTTVTGTRSITTTGDTVNFATGVTLSGGTLAIDTTSGSAVGATITFQSTLTGTTAGVEPLSLTAGTGGDILFTGAVGGTRLGAVTINSARNVTEAAGLTAASLTQVAGTGTTLLSGAVNTNTGTGVSLTTAGAITVDNTLTTTGGGTVTLANGGLLTLNGDIAADGAVAQTGAGLVTIDTDRSIITTGDAVGFATGVTLVNTSGTGTLSIDTTTGGNATGNSITFSGTLDGTTAGAEPVTLTAGTNGNLLFTGAVGTTGAASRLGAVTITNAKNVTESAGLTAASLTQLAGTGTTTLEGAVNTTGAFDVTSNAIVFGGGGSATAGASSALTADDMDLAGQPINVGANRLTLRPSAAGQVINLGGADAAGTLGLTTTDLAGITAGVLQIGDSTNTGGVVLSADTATPATATTLSVITGGGMTTTGGTLTVPSLRLDAVSGIGTTGARFGINADTLTARTTTVGGIFLTETDNVALGTVDTQTNLSAQAGAGDVTLVAGGAITQGAGTLTGNNVRLTSGTGIGTSGNRLSVNATTLSAQTTAGGIFLTETDNVALGTVDTQTNLSAQAGAGDVTLVAGGAITQGAGTLTGNNVRLTSGTGIGTSGNRLSVNATTLSAQTTVGGIFLTETDNVALGTADGQTNLSAAGGAADITLVAGGAITQGVGLISATNVRLEAGTGIGASGTPLSTQTDTLAAKTTTSGGIYLTEAAAGGALTIGTVEGLAGVATAGNGAIDIRTTSGSVVVNNAVAANGSGNVDLEAGGSGSNLALTAPVSSGSGNLTLTANTNVDLSTAAADLTTGGGGSITVRAINGSLLMVEGATIQTVAGRITLESYGTMTISNTSLDSTTGDMDLTSDTAGIEMGVATTGGTVTLTAATTISNSNGSTTDVTASALTATAGTSITLDTSVGTASLTGPGGTPTTGDITLSNTGGPLTLTSVQSGGDVTVTNTTGVMTLGQVAAAGFVNLANLNGAILDDNSVSPAVIAGAGATLSAKGVGGVVGDNGNALSTRVTGGIFTIQAGGTSGSVSGNIDAVSWGGRAPDTIDTPSPIILDGRLTDPNVLSATQQAGQAVAAISASAQAQSAFEAVESQIIEVVGDPSEQIEEELRLDEEVSPSPCATKDEDERKRRGCP